MHPLHRRTLFRRGALVVTPKRLEAMSVLLFLIPLAALMVLVAVIAFRWAVRAGQFDDLETPPVRILFDDD
jgi:cbb3-type cytochrome oxidase maturation protein